MPKTWAMLCLMTLLRFRRGVAAAAGVAVAPEVVAARRLGTAFLVAIAAAATPSPAHAVERILRFISDVEVERNGDLLVTETIRVQAEGNQIRRGILRDFPTTYARPDGTRVVVGF